MHSDHSRRVVVAMALEIEAQGVFAGADIEVVYTGVGKINAAYSLTRRLLSIRDHAGASLLVLNLGTAGSSKFAVGSFVACDEFVQRDMDASALGFERGATPYDAGGIALKFATVFPHLPRGVCGSGDNFETCASDLRCDVFDMEAYALARVCALEGVDFACVKFITDGADAGAAQSWQANLARASGQWLDLYRYAQRLPTL
jgi:adenosylhomocysteine nucleosidase